MGSLSQFLSLTLLLQAMVEGGSDEDDADAGQPPRTKNEMVQPPPVVPLTGAGS